LKLIALIPAYRPDTQLIQIAQSLLERDFSAVLVINDGSGTEYNSIFENLSKISNVDVLTHTINLGKGAALKNGINTICGKWGDEVGIVTVDADGQHLTDDVEKVGAELRNNTGDLILGARSFTHDMPFRSRLGNTLTRFLLKSIHGLKLTDTQTGLRGMSANRAKEYLTIRANRYDFELDMLLVAKKSGIPITEVPIKTIYLDDNKSSHFNPVFDSAKIYFSLFRFLGTSLVAALLDNIIFIILFSLGNTILTSQAGSRAIVMVVNYVMVKKMVFHSSEQNKIAIPKYVLAVVLLGAISYGLIIAASDVFSIPVILAKIAVETIVFVSSFLVQRSFIFKEDSI
jgi:glycosyltransferase involved in cell wall biosynthesis